MITDEYIIDCFYKNNVCNFNRFKSKFYTEEVKKYLANRFKYSKSEIETIWCIKHKIDRDNLICPVCHNGILPFRPYPHAGRTPFLIGCSEICRMKIRNNHSIQSNIIKYGTEFPVQNEYIKNEILNKRKKTCLEKYGTEYAAQSDYVKNKIKQSCLEKYGVEYPFQTNAVKNKIKQTCLRKYGVVSTLLVPEIRQKQKETCIKRYGVDNPFKASQVKAYLKSIKCEMIKKSNNTKIKNNTFNKSKLEDECYSLLCDKFGSDNIIRQYKSELYPFNCDFYIKNNNILGHDLYIECNFHWTHNDHLYDKNNIKDIITKCKWKNKNTKFYDNAIKTWTERDVNKNCIFKLNKLNYKLFYNIKEFKDYFK